jgi:tetratricopeptide (TPR) repeat protein
MIKFYVKSLTATGLSVICAAAFSSVALAADTQSTVFTRDPATNPVYRNDGWGIYRTETEQYMQSITFDDWIGPNLKLLSPYINKKPAERLKALKKTQATAQCFRATYNQIYDRIGGQSMAPSMQYAAHNCAALADWMAGNAESTCGQLKLGAFQLEEAKYLKPPLDHIDAKRRENQSGKKAQELATKLYKASGCANMPAETVSRKAAALTTELLTALAVENKHRSAQLAREIASLPADPPLADLLKTRRDEIANFAYSRDQGLDYYGRGDIRAACDAFQKALSALRKQQNAEGVLARVTGDSGYKDAANKTQETINTVFNNYRDDCIAAGNRLI